MTERYRFFAFWCYARIKINCSDVRNSVLNSNFQHVVSWNCLVLVSLGQLVAFI
jgi:hypothetical protein